MERAVGKNEKLEKLSWKVRNEIGKIEVGKFGPKLESTTELEKWLMKVEILSINLAVTLSNFGRNFPTSRFSK